MKIKDITNKSFGKLTAIKLIEIVEHYRQIWLCKCDCGNTITTRLDSLTTGHTKSCGKCSKNIFYKENNYMVGLTTKGEQFYFDLEDYDDLSKHTWSFSNHGYLRARINNKSILLHKFIIKQNNRLCIDHANGNKYDNRKNNLRLCSHAENLRNQKKQENKTSIYKGVCWNKAKNKWKSYIGFNSKLINIGYFDSEIDAAKSYNLAAVKYHGEFARINEVPE